MDKKLKILIISGYVTLLVAFLVVLFYWIAAVSKDNLEYIDMQDEEIIEHIHDGEHEEGIEHTDHNWNEYMVYDEETDTTYDSRVISWDDHEVAFDQTLKEDAVDVATQALILEHISWYRKLDAETLEEYFTPWGAAVVMQKYDLEPSEGDVNFWEDFQVEEPLFEVLYAEAVGDHVDVVYYETTDTEKLYKSIWFVGGKVDKISNPKVVA